MLLFLSPLDFFFLPFSHFSMWFSWFNYWKPLRPDNTFDALLHHPDFQLVHVANDEKRTMTVIRPSTDTYHLDRLATRECQFYALSHLWGANAHDHPWHEIGTYIHDQQGRPIDPIPMRPEKRDTLLALLESKPDSYWWIDVICTRADMPLVIMGSIYRYCDCCYAMVDCLPAAMETISGDKLVWMCRDFHYKDPCCRLTVQWSKHVQALGEFLDCQWWQRVWTWQEMALQKQVVMISERSGKRWMDTCIEAVQLVHLYKMRAYYYRRTHQELELESPHTSLVDPILMESLLDKVSRQCAELFRPRNFADLTVDGYALSSPYAFFKLIESLGNSPRTCMDPVDYVYGVLGFLLWDIPRMNHPDDVWQAFLSQLEDYITRSLEESHYMGGGIVSIDISDKARTFDLALAKNMTDVYRGLLQVKAKDGSIFTI